MRRTGAAGRAPRRGGAARRWLDRLILAGGALAAAIILAALAIILYAVAMRYFAGRPLPWRDELVGYLVVAMVMLGAGATELRGGHIGIDVLTNAAGPQARRGLAVLASAAVLGFSVLFGWSAWQTVTFSRGFGLYSTGALQVEIWIVQAPMLAGAALLGLAALANLVRAVRGEGPPDGGAPAAAPERAAE